MLPDASKLFSPALKKNRMNILLRWLSKDLE